MTTERVFAFVLGVLWCTPAWAQAIDQEQPEADVSAKRFPISGDNALSWAQVVTSGVGGRLVAVDLPVSCDVGELVVAIHGTDGGLPDTSVVATQAFDGSTLSSDPGKFTRLVFDEPACLDKGEAFAIVLDATDECVITSGLLGDPYARGDAAFAFPPDFQWIPLEEELEPPFDVFDLPFATWMEPGCEEETPPGVTMTKLESGVTSLVQQGQVPPFAGWLLLAETTLLHNSWRNGYVDATLAVADTFARSVGDLMDGGFLAKDLGTPLADETIRLRDDILRLTEPPIDDDLVCTPPPKDGFVVLRVGSGQPFATLQAAEAEADRRGLTRAEYVLSPGTYNVGVFEVTRDTIVRGTGIAFQNVVRGEFVVRGPYLLSAQGLSIVAPATTASTVVTTPCASNVPRGAAVWLDDQCATAELIDAVTSGGLYGVYQRRGSTTTDNAWITSTRTSSLELASGTGLLACSGDVTLIDTTFSANGGAGVIANGDDTRLWATNLAISNTRLSPVQIPHMIETGRLASGIGALWVGGGASAEIVGYRLQDNDGVGIFVVGAGTEARFQAGQVTRTRTIVSGPASIGHSLVVLDEAVADLRSFRLVGLTTGGRPQSLVGAYLDRDAQLQLHDGEVTRFRVGAAVLIPSYDVRLLSDEVAFRDNDRSVDFGGNPLPLPEPMDTPDF